MREPMIWYRFWAEYPFPNTLSKEEDYFLESDMPDLVVKEMVREWAEDTPDGKALLDLVGRSIRYGFERVDSLPSDVKKRKIQKCEKIIERQVQIIRSLK